MKTYDELLSMLAHQNGCKISNIENCKIAIRNNKRNQSIFMLATNSDIDHEFIQRSLAVAGFEGSILVSISYTLIEKILVLNIEDYILQTPCGQNNNWFIRDSSIKVMTMWDSKVIDYCATTSGQSAKVYQSDWTDADLVEDANRIMKAIREQYARIVRCDIESLHQQIDDWRYE